VKDTWTQSDELKLRELSDRKARVYAFVRAPIQRLARDMRNANDLSEDDLADWLIQRADQIRDLLQPFDSGVRCAPSEE
jgi:hypothetical protein